jgi:hypothetical protein
MMVVTLVVGVVIGATIEIDRANTRRDDYLALAYEADVKEQRSRSLATRYIAQATATRKWVAEGSQGDPPGAIGRRDPAEAAYTFGPKDVEMFRRSSEKAMELASHCELQGEYYRRAATDAARRKQRFARNASFPRVFFAPTPPAPSPGTP